MRKRDVFITALLCMTLTAGTSCGIVLENPEVNADKEIVSSSVEDEKSSLELTHDKYTEMFGFEYDEEALRQMNEANGMDYFGISSDNGSIEIEGLISTRKVNDEKDALENIKMVRSILGLINPDEQLKYSGEIQSGDVYRYDFDQYYAGLKVYDAGVVAVAETGSKLVTNTSARIIGTDELEKTNLDGILSESEILEKYKGAEIKEKCIWTLRVSEPKVAYIIYQNDMTLVIDARTTEIIDEWSNIID